MGGGVTVRVLLLILILIFIGGFLLPQEDPIPSSPPEVTGENIRMTGRLKGDLEWEITAARLIKEQDQTHLAGISQGVVHLEVPIFFQAEGAILREGSLELVKAALTRGDIEISADKVILREGAVEFAGSGKIVLEVAGDA